MRPGKRMIAAILILLVCVSCFASCGSKVTAESLLSGAAAAPGMRGKITVKLLTSSGDRDIPSLYEGSLAAKDNIRYVKGNYRQAEWDRDREQYAEFFPGETPEENAMSLYSYQKVNGIWLRADVYDNMATLAEMIQALENPVLSPPTKNAGSYYITGTMPIKPFRDFSMVYLSGPSISAALVQCPSDEQMNVRIEFSAISNMPVKMSLSLPAPVELEKHTMKALDITLDITDMTLSSLEIPQEVRDDAKNR